MLGGYATGVVTDWLRVVVLDLRNLVGWTSFDTGRSASTALSGGAVVVVVGPVPEITAPTLVIHGESDRLVPVKNGRIIAERVPGARVTLLVQRASHMLFTDQPEDAHGVLLGFLDELWPSGR
jgi:pimeloyl-ACP methyl ester carboxylesterase